MYSLNALCVTERNWSMHFTNKNFNSYLFHFKYFVGGNNLDFILQADTGYHHIFIVGISPFALRKRVGRCETLGKDRGSQGRLVCWLATLSNKNQKKKKEERIAVCSMQPLDLLVFEIGDIKRGDENKGQYQLGRS